MELKNDYLTRQLIAYIGNKRSLLPFLARVFTGLAGKNRNITFLDPFCGSGSVSRLAKYLDYRVLANDWELYARIVTECHVVINKTEADSLFKFQGGMEQTFSFLNREGRNNGITGYIARHYAPDQTETADYRYERLFYTRENGLFIDRVRDLIEEMYPEEGSERTILLAALLYQAATHANTSGVFKAYHKGFGGHGKDALKRILQPMELEVPLLIDSSNKCEVFSQDAQDFVTGKGADICYLDPPYNCHQYGSNYFMLNTIAKWDKPEVSMERTETNRLKEKAGIRKDWVTTRSAFCSRQTAGASFRQVLDNLDARHICLSYNTEGIIPFEELCDSMADRGKLSIQSTDYITYRGGKQSISRTTHNIELLLILDRNEVSTARDRSGVARIYGVKRIHSLLKSSFSPGRVFAHFKMAEGEVLLSRKGDRMITVPTEYGYRFQDIPHLEQFTEMDLADLEVLEQKLRDCQCRDRQEECSILIDLLLLETDPAGRKRLQQRLLLVVKKFAYKKYRNEFFSVVERLDSLMDTAPDQFGALGASLKDIRRIAHLRFTG